MTAVRPAVVAGLLLLAACAYEEADTSAPAPEATDAPSATSAVTTTEPGPAPEEGTRAPWDADAVASGEVPDVLLTEWNRAENRGTCAPLHPTDQGPTGETATPRRASFSGGWAVAWDAPDGPGRERSGEYCEDCGRGAYGVAGAGVEVDDADLAQFEHRLGWPGGDGASYGPSGDPGRGGVQEWLAYVRVEGESCLYNVWSFLGREHLERLLAGLRRVEVEPDG